MTLWTGLGRRSFSFVRTEEIIRQLAKCDVLTSTHCTTDSHGFKKTEFVVGSGQPTVLFLGDSFTQGLHVSAEGTFVNIFGRLVRDIGYDAVPVNTGVSGYGALEMCWMLETYAPALNAKMVVVSLFPNDVHWKYHAVIRGDRVYQKGYDQMFHYLDRIRGYCGDNHISLVVVVIPAKEQMGEIPGPGVFQARVATWCEEKDILALDPLDYFRRLGQSRVYLSWDPHFSEEGHRHYARFIFEQTLGIVEETFHR